jgi:hypothetical protein
MLHVWSFLVLTTEIPSLSVVIDFLQLDVTNASKAIYRERRKYFPALPKSKDDVHDAVDILDTKTNKSENFVISNDRNSGIMIFSTLTNLQCMCRVMDELFIDGTFKCCPRYFCQLYKILLPPPRGEQGATGIILANGRGTISEKGQIDYINDLFFNGIVKFIFMHFMLK